MRYLSEKELSETLFFSFSCIEKDSVTNPVAMLLLYINVFKVK